MNNLHRKAIELKYQGKSYTQISNELSNELTEGTLKQYFSEEGLLFVPYHEYETAQNKELSIETTTSLKRLAVRASKALGEALETAIENNDVRTLLKIAELVLPKNKDTNTEDNTKGTGNAIQNLSTEEFDSMLVKEDFDPATNQSIKYIKSLTENERIALVKKRWEQLGIL